MKISNLRQTWFHRLLQVLYVVAFFWILFLGVFIFIDEYPQKVLDRENTQIICDHNNSKVTTIGRLGVYEKSKGFLLDEKERSLKFLEFCGYEYDGYEKRGYIPISERGSLEKTTSDFEKQQASYSVIPVYFYNKGHIAHYSYTLLFLILQIIVFMVIRFSYYYIFTGKRIWLKTP